MKPTTPLQEEMSEEVMPWKTELIISLFKRQKILRIVLGVSIFFAGILAIRTLYVGICLYIENTATLNWPAVSCDIVHVKYCLYAKESMYGLWDPGNPSWREHLRKIRDAPIYYTTRHYKIQYTYVFEGKSYTSNRYSIPRCYEMVTWDSRQENPLLSLIYDNYIKEHYQMCYVDPEDPGNAVLYRSQLLVSDYALHMFRSFLVFMFYLIIPGLFYKKYRDFKKQLSELVTGCKENILEDINRVSDMSDVDEDTS
jgi:hypothetical protein